MALSGTFLDCEVCQNIWRRFADQDATHEINLGSFEDALSSQCPGHTPLVEHFRDYCRNCRKGDASFRDSDDMGIRAAVKGSSITLTESLSKLGLFWGLLLGKKDSVSNHPGTGRILDPDWADLDVVREWKNQCLSSHGPRCENPMKIWPTRPAWLIDIENKCVVSGQCCGAFVALSYRWGEDSDLGFRVDANTMPELQKPNALDSPEISTRLAPIVRHAMYLTSIIGERYLWVDALCIVHSDNVVTAEQLTLMGAIYANAIVTIIAADGDSQDGLLGLRDYKMSQRRILFNQKELHWECQCNVWHEEMILGAEIDKYIDPRLGVILAGFPHIGSLNHLITEYNRRELRYDEDALPGISGLLSVVSRSFTGGFLYGLPEMTFDRGLGWKPHWDHVNLRRRIQSNRPNSSRLSHLSLPSWSWVGWQGLVSGGYGEAAQINHRQTWIEETIPITEWYTSSSPSGSPLRRIKSAWFENREAFKDFTKPLPAGWTRHNVLTDDSTENEPRLYPDGCESYIFKHCKMPDDDYDSWYFPFPVRDIQESTPPFTPEQTPYIFCETKRAHLWAHQSGNGNTLNICNKSGSNIGFLHLHNQEQLELFPKTVTDDVPGVPVELIAIYRSRICSKTWDEKRRRYAHPQKRKETYEVLWVEWEDGVAYRLASGRVERADWEGLDLEHVSLILG
ncbi:hypothetical protein AOQ84DRAFT_279507 [Glonium stellatum]|uniref:Heterokaryon incompatibility domain-containing protein n=1 Tax=Glonium stellatum TaxID=574774 RepID=A0A8E2FDV1_9PEZI|nr:hypothetical protein AOQ84DRAFT_279507 [Glonium stellatum]